MSYAGLIRQFDTTHDPRHIEAWMRENLSAGVFSGCLDGLSREEFGKQVREAAACVDMEPNFSEELAKAHGLVKR